MKCTLDGSQTIENIHENELLKQIKVGHAKQKQIYEKDRNSRVWLQYMDMLDIFRSNIRSERTG